MCLFCLIHTVLYAAPLDGGLCKRLCKVEGFARIIKVRKRENISLLKLLLELPQQQGRPGLQWPTLAVALLPMFVGGRCWGCSPCLQHYIGAAGSESRPSPSLLPLPAAAARAGAIASNLPLQPQQHWARPWQQCPLPPPRPSPRATVVILTYSEWSFRPN